MKDLLDLFNLCTLNTSAHRIFHRFNHLPPLLLAYSVSLYDSDYRFTKETLFSALQFASKVNSLLNDSPSVSSHSLPGHPYYYSNADVKKYLRQETKAYVFGEFIYSDIDAIYFCSTCHQPSRPKPRLFSKKFIQEEKAKLLHFQRSSSHLLSLSPGDVILYPSTSYLSMGKVIAFDETSMMVSVLDVYSRSHLIPVHLVITSRDPMSSIQQRKLRDQVITDHVNNSRGNSLEDPKCKQDIAVFEHHRKRLLNRLSELKLKGIVDVDVQEELDLVNTTLTNLQNLFQPCQSFLKNVVDPTMDVGAVVTKSFTLPFHTILPADRSTLREARLVTSLAVMDLDVGCVSEWSLVVHSVALLLELQKVCKDGVFGEPPFEVFRRFSGLLHWFGTRVSAENYDVLELVMNSLYRLCCMLSGVF
ncbi:hypothetical protein GEMRC1_013085 [Eukaryota sp. GEM-RC1]